MNVITVQENGLLRDYIDAVCPLASFAFARLLRDRDIKVNGKRVAKNIAVYKGDRITYYLTAKEQSRTFFDILFEDDNFLVVDKESGVSSEGLFQHLQREQELYFIHRLDRNTSGIILFAKTERAKEELLAAFKASKIYKEYHAIVVDDNFQKEQAVLHAYLKKDSTKATVQILKKAMQGAVEICTEYKVLERYTGYAKLQIVLHTGRTHQIRAHLANEGHPIAGDEKYGDRDFNKKYHLKRQILVAKKLKLNLPNFLAMQDRVFVSKHEAELIEKI